MLGLELVDLLTETLGEIEAEEVRADPEFARRILGEQAQTLAADIKKSWGTDSGDHPGWT